MSQRKITQKWPILIGIAFASFVGIGGIVLDQMNHGPKSFIDNLFPIILVFVLIFVYIFVWFFVNIIFIIHSKFKKTYEVPTGISLIASVIFAIFLAIGIYFYLPVYHAGRFHSFSASETIIGDNWTHLAFQGFNARNEKVYDICHIVYSKNMQDSYISFALELTRFQGKIVVVIRRDYQYTNEYIYLPFEEAIYEYKDGKLIKHEGSLKDL